MQRKKKVSKIVRHPEFKSHNLDHDLAMLLTATKIEFSINTVEAIGLPTHASVENDVAVVSGWGETSVSI